MRVYEVSPSALQRFMHHLPERPQCSDCKRLKYIHDKKVAVSFPYIQINYPVIRYIVFDLDYTCALLAASDHDLPEPTMAVANRSNGHCHYFYELLEPLPRKYSRSTRSLLGDVTSAFGDILCADRCITRQRQLVKNPLHEQWEVLDSTNSSGIFTLGELAEYIPSEWKIARANTGRFNVRRDIRVRTFEETYNPLSRNCSLFENGRYYAYFTVSDCCSYEELHGRVLDWIEKLNDTEVPRYFKARLPYPELRSIARSIASWTYSNRSRFREVNEGAMNLPTMKGRKWMPDEYEREVRRRRRLAARRTNSIRRQATTRKIMAAVRQCRSSGMQPGARIVSELSGVPLRTVYNYKELICG